jgi:hypothetical protein
MFIPVPLYPCHPSEAIVTLARTAPASGKRRTRRRDGGNEEAGEIAKKEALAVEAPRFEKEAGLERSSPASGLIITKREI